MTYDSAPHWVDNYPLSIRSYNCIKRHFASKADLLAAWPIDVGRFPNFGKKSILKVAEVMGLPPCKQVKECLSQYSDKELADELAVRAENRALVKKLLYG